MTKRAPDVEAWVRSQIRHRGGAKCRICADEKIAQACDRAGATWAKERPEGMSFAAMAEMLEELFSFSVCPASVRNHILKHRPELYRRICGA